MPAVIFGQRVLGPAFGQPGFLGRLRGAADADPIEGLTGVDIILDDTEVLPDPDADDAAEIEMRYAFGRHQAAPSHVASVARQLLAEQLRTHGRVDSVGADQNIASRNRSIGELQRDTVSILIDALDTRAQTDALFAEPAQQNVEQLRAVGGIIGRAEMRLRLLPERRVVETFAAVPAAIVAAFGIGGHTLERLAQPKLEQDTRGV